MYMGSLNDMLLRHLRGRLETVSKEVDRLTELLGDARLEEYRIRATKSKVEVVAGVKDRDLSKLTDEELEELNRLWRSEMKTYLVYLWSPKQGGHWSTYSEETIEADSPRHAACEYPYMNDDERKVRVVDCATGEVSFYETKFILEVSRIADPAL